MGSVTASVTLAATPERVWERFADPNGFEQWLTIHTKWKGEVPTGFAVGTTVSEVVTMLGMANTIEWTVREFAPPSRLVIAGTGMAGVRVTFALAVTPTDAGSTAAIEARFEGQMIVGALGKAVEKDAKKNLDESLARFAELVA